MRKLLKILSMLIAVIFSSAVNFAQAQKEIDEVIVNELHFSISSMSVMAYDGEYLWCNKDSSFNNSLLVIDKETGIIVNQLQLPLNLVEDLTYDGQNIWVLRYDELYEIDCDDGSIVQEILIPESGYARGIAWHEGILYYLKDYEDNPHILGFDIENNEVVSLLEISGCNYPPMHVLEYLDGYFYTFHQTKQQIFKINAETGQCDSLFWTRHNVNNIYYFYPPGLTTDGFYLYYSDNYRNIFKCDVRGVYQNITLNAGWNIFSTYFIPEDLDMLSIVQPLIDAGTLDKVLDEAGNAILYFIGNWINNIGDLANTEGYYVKVNDDVDLTVEGNAVELPFEIDLTAGWNIMGYPTESAQDALTVVQPLINADELEKVLDETGNAILYFFGEWVNNIGDFMADEGYYTKVNTNTSLIISEPVLTRAKTATVEGKTEKTYPAHFSPAFTGKPFMPMGVYLIGEEFGDLDLDVGDEVAVFDDELCVGASVVEGEISIANPLIIITSMDDEIGMPGFSEGNPISYRIWDANEKRELVVNEVTNYDHATGNELNTEPSFERLGTIAVSFKSYTGGIIEPMIPETFALHQNYPNPFNPITTIRYDLPEQSYVTILIYDLLGRAVRQLVNSTQDAGYKSVVWDATDSFGKSVSAGMYLYQIRAGDPSTFRRAQDSAGSGYSFVQVRKMVLLK